MDIYTKRGSKVKFVDFSDGERDRRKFAQENGLVENQIYEVLYVERGHFHSSVYLKEFSEKGFNTIMFHNI